MVQYSAGKFLRFLFSYKNIDYIAIHIVKYNLEQKLHYLPYRVCKLKFPDKHFMTKMGESNIFLKKDL